MSEATRAIALQEAVKVGLNAGSTSADIVTTAMAFAAFLDGADSAVGEMLPPAKPAKEKVAPKQAVAKEPKKIMVPEKPPEKPAVSLEQVRERLVQLIGADKDQAVKLLAKYDATKVSGVKPEDYESVFNECGAILADLEMADDPAA